MAVDDIWLNNGEQAIGVDFEDAVEALERQHDPSEQRTVPPVYPVPVPRGTRGMRSRVQKRAIAATSPVEDGLTTTSGRRPSRFRASMLMCRGLAHQWPPTELQRWR